MPIACVNVTRGIVVAGIVGMKPYIGIDRLAVHPAVPGPPTGRLVSCSRPAPRRSVSASELWRMGKSVDMVGISILPDDRARISGAVLLLGIRLPEIVLS